MPIISEQSLHSSKKSLLRHIVYKTATKCLQMASKRAALFLFINVLFFALVSANDISSFCMCTRCGCNPNPTPSPTPSGGKCPRDALKLGVCAKVLGLVKVKVGSPPTLPCCSLLQGLVDLEAAVCLCTAIKANVLGLNLNVPVSLSLLLNVCGKKTPAGFQCA